MEKDVSIGNYLKSNREQKDISLQEIAQKTKININILRALEKNDFDKLPNKAYVKGFVKNYAKTLGLSQEQASDLLENHYTQNSTSKEEEKIEVSSQTENSITPELEETSAKIENELAKESIVKMFSQFFNKKVLLSTAAIITLILIGKGVTSMFQQLTSETKNQVSTIKESDESLFDSEASKKFAKEVAKEEEKSTEDLSVAKMDTKEDADETSDSKKEITSKKETEIKEQEINKTAQVSKTKDETTQEVNEKEKREEEVKEVSISDGKFPYKNFYPAPSQTFEIVENSPEANDESLLPANIKASKIEGKENVYIIANEEDTWISYQVDDQAIKRYILRKGRTLLLKGDRILLFLGNYFATKIFYNNKLISVNTKTGVKSLIFPAKAAKDLVLPLFPTYKGVPYKASEYQAKMADRP